MNEITAFADRLCLTLLHSLWQAIAIVLLVSLIIRLARPRAEIGYAAWMSGLMAAVVSVPVTFMMVSPGITQQQTVAVDPGQITIQPEIAARNIPVEAASTALGIAATAQPKSDSTNTTTTQIKGHQVAATSVTQNSGNQQVGASPLDFHGTAARWIVAAYSLGVVLMLLRLCLAAANAGRLVGNASIQKDDRVEQIVQSIARQWNMRITPIVAVTQHVVIPHVAGLFRPVILLPTSAMTGLTADELSLVLAHEIAHLRRFDLWAAMVQRFAEAVLFFNPAIWFLSRRVSGFREFCCDDLVCQSAASVEKNVRVRYAEALLHVVSLSAAGRFDAPGLTSLAASGRSPSELRRRIA